MRKFFKIFIGSLFAVLILLIAYFLTIKKLDNMEMERDDFVYSSPDLKTPVLLPSYFLDGERFFLKLGISSGDSLMAFCDTGGGICMMLPNAVNKYQLHSKVRNGMLKGFFKCSYLDFDELLSDKRIPAPEPLRSMNIRTPFQVLAKPYLLIPPLDEELKFMMQTMQLDAFFGQNFFMHKSWTIDYPNRQVWFNTPIDATKRDSAGVQKTGFKKNASGRNIFGHPSITIQVDGESIDVLFDTGATIVLSESGKRQFNTTAVSIGGSFIAKSIFDKWHVNHPDWNYYPNADLHNDVIEVPEVILGGHKVGPVLFASRKDEVWSEGMIQTMDKLVRGAIGGSALKYLKVCIDYNSELIQFSM
jgi:hypothetical protein